MSQTNSRLEGLDFLRGIAISLVIIFHCAIFFQPSPSYMAIFQYGAHGVQLFFIVSAITMCYMWDKRQGESRQVLKFYVRRFLRIAPIFWFAIVLYLLLKFVKADESLDSLSWVELLTSLTLMHGFSPFTINAIVPGGWSIAVEIIFYLLFPLIIRWVDSNKKSLVGAVFLFFIFNLCLTEVFRSYVLANPDMFSRVDIKEAVYQSFLTQLPVFLLGILVYRITLLGDQRSLLACGLIFVAWLALAFFLKVQTDLAARPFFWIFCLAFFGLAVVTLRLGLTNRLLVYLGKMSYSLYIFHFAVIDFFHHFVSDAFRGTLIAFVGWSLAIFVCSAIVADLSRRTLEKWSADWARVLVYRIGQPKVTASVPAKL